MKPAVVIDTNVLIVANGATNQAGPCCVLACIGSLEDAIREKLIILDDDMRILDEYRDNLSLSGQPGPGDRFLKWLWANQAHPDHCWKVTITPTDNGETDFQEFPSDPKLAGFDCDDRKFVAVVIASGCSPPIRNASDTDWRNFSDALAQHGVHVEFLCPDLMTGGH